MAKAKSPNLAKWKEYRCNLITEDTEFSRHTHSGGFIGTRDIYDYLQDNGLFNRDIKVEIRDVEEPDREPTEITGFRLEGTTLIIEVI